MSFVFDEFELDVEALELTGSGTPIKADPQVLKLLAVLVQRAGQLVTKHDLLRQVWGGRAVSENVITVAMVRLRRTLGHRSGEREFVINVHGRGYRFIRNVAQHEREKPVASAPASANARRQPFVGRERLLVSLREALAEACAGRGRACLLSGEAGIGKTRSIEVIEAEARAAGLPVAWGTCREPGTAPPLWPMLELVRSLSARLRIDPDAEPYADAFSELRGLLPELRGPLLERDELRARAPSAIGRIEPANNLRYEAVLNHRIFDAFTRVLTLAAARTPLLLVLDDLQRADSASLELLRYFIEDLPRSRILLLASLRNAEPAERAARSHLDYVCGHRNCTRLSLPRLSERDVACYVAALLDGPRQALARAVFEKSEGIPFFMSELVRQLGSSETQDARELAVADAALEVVRQRVAALDEAALGALSSAAVIGRSFELPLLQAVTGRDASALMRYLDAALASQVLVREADSRTGFRFGHELLRNVVYDALAPVERRSCHLKIARALEQRSQSGVKVPLAELAFHFHAALPDSDLQNTVKYCAQAAEAAAGVGAYPDAVRFFRRARQALDLEPDASAGLRLSLMFGQALCGRVCADPEFESLVRDTIQLARERRAGVPLARAALLLDLHVGFPALAGSRAALEDALQYLAPEETGLRASVLARLATSAPLAYDARRSCAQAAQALELAQSSGWFLAEYAAHYAQLYLHGGPQPMASSAAAAQRGDGGAADRSMRELERLCRVHANKLRLVPILLDVHRAIRAQQAGALPALREALERGGEAALQAGSRELRWHFERYAAIVDLELLDSEAGWAELEQLHKQASEEGLFGTALFCAYDQAVIGGELGRIGSLARSELRAALARDPDDLPAIWSIKLRALTALGLREEASDLLRAVPAGALAGLPVDRDYLGTLGALARSALALDAQDYAAALYELLAPHAHCFAAHGSLAGEGSIAELLGLLAAALGRRADALAHLERGVRASEQAGFARSAQRARVALEQLARSS